MVCTPTILVLHESESSPPRGLRRPAPGRSRRRVRESRPGLCAIGRGHVESRPWPHHRTRLHHVATQRNPRRGDRHRGESWAGQGGPTRLDILRMATAEHIYLGKPAHAVVDNAVRLTVSVGAVSAKGFVNAVMRRIAADDEAVLLAKATEGRSGDALTAAEFSHPEWIIRAFRDVLGPAELPALLERDNEPPRITLAARPGRISRDELPGSPLPGRRGVCYLKGTDPGSLGPVRDARAGVRILAANSWCWPFPAYMCKAPTTDGWTCALGRVERPRCWRTSSVTTHSCSRSNSTATVPTWSNPPCADSWPSRGPCRRCRHCRGFLQPGAAGRPCSGLGGAAQASGVPVATPPFRHPRAGGAAAPACSTTHLRCVGRGSGRLRRPAHRTWPRRILVVEDVLRRRDDAVAVGRRPLLPEVPDASMGTAVRLWPHRHDTDGMYLAILRRT